LFAAPLFVGARSGQRIFDSGSFLDWSWRFWLPVIMLHTGIRPNELGQALVDDVVELCGHPCLRVTTESDPEDDDEDIEDAGLPAKSLKSDAAERHLPLHPVLLELGILDRVAALRAAGEIRLFPEWRPSQGAYSNTSSKFFNRDEERAKGLLAQAGVKGRLQSLYSLRHNFKNAMKAAGFDESERKYLMGHADSSVSGKYDDNRLYRVLIDKIVALTFEGIDLDPLLKARRGGEGNLSCRKSSPRRRVKQ
jgi:integrase